MRAPTERWYGPYLVAVGAALWGTESAFRIPLNELFQAEVIVFWEHVVLVLVFLPFVIMRAGELKNVSRRAFGWLIFSGVAGSAVGTVFFTLALKHGNPTTVNVVLNIQPVVSTIAAAFFFGDKLSRPFALWATVAVAAGVAVVGLPNLAATSASEFLSAGIGFALLCAAFWGMSTVAGRGFMTEMSPSLGSGLRMMIGLLSMSVIVAVRYPLSRATFWPQTASDHAGKAIAWLLLLSIASGGVPLWFYLSGLRYTRASTAGYFEMMQNLTGVAITWGFFGAALALHQVIAGLVLIAAVVMVQRSQARVEQPMALDSATG